MDFSAFSHGQIQSKLWLCETLEPFITYTNKVIILGSWYNLLGFLLLVRNNDFYDKIVGVDIDQQSVDIANKICDAFIIQNHKIANQKCSAYDVDFDEFDTVICCSTEDIENNSWYNKVPSNKLVCLQTLNIDQEIASRYDNWNILNPNYDLQTFKNKYPMNEILFQGEKEFDYGDLKYSRYMIIGKK